MEENNGLRGGAKRGICVWRSGHAVSLSTCAHICITQWRMQVKVTLMRMCASRIEFGVMQMGRVIEEE